MSGDYTRFTFKPDKNYTGVWKQPGRVGLDADWNELVDIQDRRWRAETIDIIGRCVVPSSTPDAFRLIPTGSGTFTIGIGRIYVDGLLAECHGLPPQIYDASLGEQRGTTAIPYTDQPYYPAPLPPDLTGTPGTTDLIYLDVWQREVTALEDPSIKEIALGGPDTATRLQTVWQVKALTNVGRISCTTPLDAWDALIAPSAGRLTTSALAPPASEDPCIIAPSGGYRGLENRLYRIEIHTPGTIGTARFKWSRDNGSVASAVEAISIGRDQITVRSLGRDQILRFQIDDWVEVLDDHSEFQGIAGAMARIVNLDEANQILTVSPALPASFNFDPTDANRHTRVRRWDQKQGVDADGLLPVAAGDIEIEDGIRVSFSLDPAGGSFKIADYWAFAARTADGSVELLQAAPPRGILHHYGRLALITWGATLPATTVSDCRVFWPPPTGEGCCTVIVRPGESIQAAINQLPDQGGCVCLKAGVHLITEPILIQRSNVTLQGECLAARVQRNNDINLLVILGTNDTAITNIVVENIQFEVTSNDQREETVLIRVLEGINITIRHCVLNMLGRQQNIPLQAIGILSFNCQQLAIVHNQMQDLIAGVIAANTTGLWCSQNNLRGTLLPVSDLISVPLGVYGFWSNGLSTIEHNQIENYATGVYLQYSFDEASADQSVVHQNRILRPLLETDAPVPQPLFAIDVNAPECLISQNYITADGGVYGGIRVTHPHVRVLENQIRSQLERGSTLPIAIWLTTGENSDFSPDHCLIQGNILQGRQNGIILFRAAEGIQIIGNQIDSLFQQTPNIAIGLLDGEHIAVTDNLIRDAQAGIVLIAGLNNRVLRNQIRDSAFGVAASQESNLDVSENSIENINGFGLLGSNLGLSTKVTHNRLNACAYQLFPSSLVFLVCDNLCIESCEVLNTGHALTNITNSNLTVGIFAAFIRTCQIHNNRVAYTERIRLNANQEHRALALSGVNQPAPEEFPPVGHASISNNVFNGLGLSHLVEIVKAPTRQDQILGFAKVIFSHNQCEHLLTRRSNVEERATVSLWGRHLIVMGNQVKADTESFPSINLRNSARAAVMGNIVTGDFTFPAAITFPLPLEDYNADNAFVF